MIRPVYFLRHGNNWLKNIYLDHIVILIKVVEKHLDNFCSSVSCCGRKCENMHLQECKKEKGVPRFAF